MVKIFKTSTKVIKKSNLKKYNQAIKGAIISNGKLHDKFIDMVKKSRI